MKNTLCIVPCSDVSLKQSKIFSSLSLCNMNRLASSISKAVKIWEQKRTPVPFQQPKCPRFQGLDKRRANDSLIYSKWAVRARLDSGDTMMNETYPAYEQEIWPVVVGFQFQDGNRKDSESESEGKRESKMKKKKKMNWGIICLIETRKVLKCKMIWRRCSP